MNQHTDQQLQLALVKMLPEEIIVYDVDKPHWRNKSHPERAEPVIDTEWLHVCWLVFQLLTPAERIQYAELLANETSVIDWGYYPGEESADWDAIATIANSSWQQRAAALCKVKGIEIWKNTNH